MSNLLIHSMSEFSEIIVDALAIAGAREIVEIGAEYGGMSAVLADYAAAEGGRLTSIDPAPKRAFLDWAATANVRHIAKLSLAALDDLSGVDAWLVDGDHNWFTVYHELKAIQAATRRDGKPLLVFLHDVCWPAARRDMYYAPDQIPAEFRHPYDYEGGALIDQAGLFRNRGFRGMGSFAFASHEGGPRNGVLTAVEDFLEEARADGRAIAYAEVPAVFGLGIIFDTDADWSEQLTGLLLPYHDNALLRSLEQNRLKNYLKVLDWQDRAA
jgi:hypothetical protein